MEVRKVGRSGFSVSRAGLGTMTWGVDVSPADARRLARRFCDAGGTLFDTAPVYGHGAAEKIIGKLIHTDLNRDDVVIATKGGFHRQGEANVVDTSAGAMLADLEGSLRRLHTDHVDLWQIHAWGDAPLEETLAAVDRAVSSGMARYAGVSNFVGWQTAAAATWQAAVPGRTPLVCGQTEYSLLARRAEVEVIPALHHHGMGLLAWSPIGRGVLTGKYRHATPRDSRAASDHFAWFVEPFMQPRSTAIVNAVATAAQGLELTCAQVAYLWVRDAPGVSAALLGARTVEQLDEFLAIEDRSLPEPIVSALDDVSGGPHQGR